MSDYDTDIVVWSARQAGLLRRRAAGERVNESDLDWSNIAEEIESVGNAERLDVQSKIAVILEHLIKLLALPATDPGNPDTSKEKCLRWRSSIRAARSEIRRTLEYSPSLRAEVGWMILEETPDVRADVAATLADYGEEPRVDINSLSFTEDQVLGDWFPPDA